MEFSYYEHKYLVPQQDLSRVVDLLDEFFIHSDPFEQGKVDSIYYDTWDQHFLSQCLNGDAHKLKFRIRGYGDDSYVQVHEKIKDLSGVSKHKASVEVRSLRNGCAPEWNELAPKNLGDKAFQRIVHDASQHGALLPSIRVKYHRYRYRNYEYRMTLDCNIEVSSLANGFPHAVSFATLPYHVLEIKAKRRNSRLPCYSLLRLQQVSFSKFMLGLNVLNNDARDVWTI